MITGLARHFDHCLSQQPSGAITPKCRAHVKPLHFTDAFSELSNADTTRDLAILACEEQSSSGRSVPARQFSQFLLEILETKINVDRPGVLLEQLAHHADVLYRMAI